MQLIMFTKHLEGLDLSGLIEALQSAGLDGADLCVRDGYPVTPGNMEKMLPVAVQQFTDADLVIPLVTGPTDFAYPDADAERFYDICGQAGVKHIKLGYWRWRPGMDYWAEVDTIRGYLDKFQELSVKSGVQTLVHTHSGTFMGLNASAAMTLVQGYEPQHIGIFADPGHLALCGEPIDMALNIVSSHLSLVAFKDFIRQPIQKDGQVIWGKALRKLGWGMVDWTTTLKSLQAMNFTGPISLHAEYAGEPVETVIDLTRADVRFVRALAATLKE